MSACSVVRFCAVVNKLHFYFYILVVEILCEKSHLSVWVFRYMCHITELQSCICVTAVCKVHRLTLLLQVRTLWRCCDSLFFEVPPLASDTLLTTPHPLLCCRPLITSKFLASELSFHGCRSPEIAWGKIWTVWWMF
jgi:hypothetical protein